MRRKVRRLQSTVQDQGETIEDHKKTIEKQRKTIEKQRKTIEKQGETIEKQGETIEKQGETIEEQGGTIEEQEEAIKKNKLKMQKRNIRYNEKVEYLSRDSVSIHGELTFNLKERERSHHRNIFVWENLGALLKIIRAKRRKMSYKELEEELTSLYESIDINYYT